MLRAGHPMDVAKRVVNASPKISRIWTRLEKALAIVHKRVGAIIVSDRFTMVRKQ
jgi:hypothetical protein